MKRSRFRPDPVQLKSKAKTEAILLVLFVIGGILLTAKLLSAREWRKAYKLKTQGVAIQGKYKNEYQVRDGRAGKTYAMKYSFTVGERNVHGSQPLSSAPPSQDVTVYYVPEHPEINAVDPAAKFAGASIPPGACGLVTLVLFGLLGHRLLRLKKYTKMIADAATEEEAASESSESETQS